MLYFHLLAEYCRFCDILYTSRCYMIACKQCNITINIDYNMHDQESMLCYNCFNTLKINIILHSNNNLTKKLPNEIINMISKYLIK